MHRILVIDDEGSVRTALRYLLEILNVTMEEAENGKVGLQKARENPPDLILCDLDMPVMDGYETLAQARQDPILASVPVIVVSGLITDENERRVMSAGANAVLRKPFSFDGLANLVRLYCGQLRA